MCRKIETVSIYDKPNESNSDFFTGNTLHITAVLSTKYKMCLTN